MLGAWTRAAGAAEAELEVGKTWMAHSLSLGGVASLPRAGGSGLGERRPNQAGNTRNEERFAEALGRQQGRAQGVLTDAGRRREEVMRRLRDPNEPIRKANDRFGRLDMDRNQRRFVAALELYTQRAREVLSRAQSRADEVLRRAGTRSSQR